MVKNKISVNKLFSTIILLMLFCVACFGFNLNKTHSYLTDSGIMMGVIKVAPTDYNVYQKLTNNSDYVNRSDKGIMLDINYLESTTSTNEVDGKEVSTNNYERYGVFATDTIYYYDVVLKNDDIATVDANSYSLRWWFEMIIDGTSHNINSAIITTDSHVALIGDYFYYVSSGTTIDYFNAQTQVSIIESIEFAGSYDSVNDSYGSLLDDVFSGSDIEFYLHIEGSETLFVV
ncbi:MAG: hypothetical protein IJX26_03820 [Clostridia bacterium]|nr:hypothetical protein [Clostridia bacterium]